MEVQDDYHLSDPIGTTIPDTGTWRRTRPRRCLLDFGRAGQSTSTSTSTMASFSRLQLAAALIEYDNDPENPAAPNRSAHDSAIFAHLRRNPRPSIAASRKSTDYLGVNLPSEGGHGGRESAFSLRPRSSIDALRNPFQGDVNIDDEVLEEEEEEEPEDDLEVDLASWGLDSFMPKEKGKHKKKEKEKVNVLPNPHPSVQSGSHRSHRSMSLGAYDSFGAGGAFLDSVSTSRNADSRRRSLGSALDMADEDAPQRPPLRQRPSSTHALIDSIPITPPLHAVPFPSQSIRSTSPTDEMGSARDPRSHGRAYSTASLGSRGLLNDAASSRPMSPGQASDFRMRTTSIASIDSKALLAEDNPFAIRPPSPSRTSRFDPKAAAHARTLSNTSMGSRILLDNDARSIMSGQPLSHRPAPRERPLSTLEMLRPKVLVMPSPLQGTGVHEAPKAREGFQLSTDGPPLPPGARSRSLSSATLLTDLNPPATAMPIASNSFTPNPRSSMTLSQLTFRNQLMVDGQRDIAYTDIDGNLQRATEDGEQITPAYPEEEPARPVTVIVDEPDSHGRPVGKLYGKSLIDDLEQRKAVMRGKARVFKGDERPSMMHRGQVKRSSTLIDPATLNVRPTSQSLAGLSTHGSRPTLGRRQSTGGGPLLNFSDEGSPSPGLLGASPPAMTKSRSVFGTDVLWEREMAKLREMEANEEAARKAQAAIDALEEAKRSKKKGKGKKGKGKNKEEASPEVLTPESPALPRVSAEPPTLPAIPKGITRGPPPPVNDDDSESESDSEADGPPALGPKGSEAGAEGWFAGSSDDEKAGPVRTTGVGPRYPKRARGQSAPAQRQDDDSEEEDLPLAATIGRAVERATKFGTSLAADDSDEDKPLASVLDKAKLKFPDVNFDNVLSPSGSGSKGPTSPAAGHDDEDEDDMPLGLRASRLLPVASSGGDEDDDDKPLALHPDQQRRTQYLMLQQQQQQQQQQMMMQAQMQNSMMFGNPSLMGSGFFGPPIAPPMMMGPMPVPVPMSPPPMSQDQGKFGRVDKWRHDVAVEGQP
ncbi:hypothetical protein EVG20_g22 [Dentipellis fragilis]|uniref:Uncharacterized protein n=1 Tax=Dentipellis fragilis TaxID=205917 RepID=A0A4Y9ZDU7_9AGAM|nr:hypothetical protein EVG20_g22 [Dentipellis fragilis]